MKQNNYINIFLLSGSWIIAWALNYIYHPLMLQYMSLEEFWVFGSLVGIFNILGIITGGIVLFLNKEISSHIGNQEKIKYIFYESFKILSLLWLALYLFFTLLSPFLTQFLKIENHFFIILVGISIIFSFIWSSMDPVLRGLKKFHILARNNIISPLVKLCVWVSLVAGWMSIYGAIFGFLSGSAVVVLLMFFTLRKYFKTTWNMIEDNHLSSW